MSNASDPLTQLNEAQRAVLAALREEGSAPASYLRPAGLRPAAVRKALEELEALGVIERISNAYGAETPYWWQPLPHRPEGFTIPADEPIAVGQFYDRKGEDQVWFEVTADPDENEMVRVALCAGPHRRSIHVPAWTVVGPRSLWWRRVAARNITAFSSQFACPVHGECSEEMVRTDKTCALCRTGLIRL